MEYEEMTQGISTEATTTLLYHNTNQIASNGVIKDKTSSIMSLRFVTKCGRHTE